MCWNCYWWWQLTHILHCQWAKTSINNSKSVVNVFRASYNGHVLFAVFLLFPYLSRYGTNKKLPTKKPAKNTRAYGWGLALSITRQLEFSPSNQFLQLWKKHENTTTACIKRNSLLSEAFKGRKAHGSWWKHRFHGVLRKLLFSLQLTRT